MLQVTGHLPTLNATGVFRNETIKVYFSKPIQPDSVTWDTFNLTDDNFTSVVGDLGVTYNSSGQVYEVDFAPTSYLTADTQYNVYVFGTPNSILAVDNDHIQNPYFYSFVTGTGYYDSTGAAGAPSGTTTVTTSSVTFTGLYIRSTSPQNLEPNVSVSGIINVYFNMPLSTSISDLSGYITISTEDVLG